MNKSAHLVIEGNARVDIEVFRKIQQALVHLVNNSLDHGIEKVRDRLNAGKPASGLVRVDWETKEALVMVTFSDDGAGIDTERIRERLIGNGTNAQDFSDQELVAYIFESGFTTKDSVSDTSGRGIGLDVVKTNLEDLGGSVHVTTTRGKGTSFHLTFPQKPLFVPGRIP